MLYLLRLTFYRHLKYGKIGLRIQVWMNFGSLAEIFESYVIESFCDECCVCRPPKPRYRAQIYCSILYSFIVKGFSNTVKYGDFDVYGHIWNTHEILTIHYRAINLCSIHRFWSSIKNIAEKQNVLWCMAQKLWPECQNMHILEFEGQFHHIWIAYKNEP